MDTGREGRKGRIDLKKGLKGVEKHGSLRRGRSEVYFIFKRDVKKSGDRLFYDHENTVYGKKVLLRSRKEGTRVGAVWLSFS